MNSYRNSRAISNINKRRYPLCDHSHPQTQTFMISMTPISATRPPAAAGETATLSQIMWMRPRARGSSRSLQIMDGRTEGCGQEVCASGSSQAKKWVPRAKIDARPVLDARRPVSRPGTTSTTKRRSSRGRPSRARTQTVGCRRRRWPSEGRANSMRSECRRRR